MLYDLYAEGTEEKIMSCGRPAAGWFCSYTPLELMDAAGYLPVRVSGVRSPSGIADSIMHTNICPFVKACVEAAESGKYDFLDCVVLTNGCDAQRRLYDVWKSRNPKLPVYLLTVPKKNTPASVALLSGQMAALRSWLEKLSGKEISDEKIIGSIKQYAEFRAAAARLDKKRREPNASLEGSRFAELILTAQRMVVSEAIKLLNDEAYRNSLEKLMKGPSVIVAGNMLDDPEWLRMIESYGARVAADDLCTGRRFWDMPAPDTNAPPLTVLAAAYLSKPPCPRMADPDDAIEHMRRLVEEVRPDGVVFHILKFCDTHLYNVPELRKILQDMGIKALFIESDYTPVSGQAATRIQAFVEML